MQNNEPILLTHEEQLAKFDDLFGHYENKGKLFEPTLEFYNLLDSSDGILAAAKQLYRWLGIKPYHLHVSYGVDSTANTVILPVGVRYRPYEAAALLVKAVLEHSLVHRKHYSPDPSFLEFATIQAGFGIVVLNALEPTAGAWRVKSPVFRLQEINTADYVTSVLEYADFYHVDLTAYIASMTPQTQEHLSSALTFKTHKVAVPGVITHQLRLVQLQRLRLIMLATILLIPVCVGFYIWAQHPYRPSAQVIAQYQKTIDLKARHEACAAEAQKQQNTYDLNDIFMERQIDATLVRCASLRNQYNYEVDQYNKMVRD